MIKHPDPPSDGRAAVQRAVAYVQETSGGEAGAELSFPPMRVFTGDPARAAAWWYPSPIGAAEVSDVSGAVSFHSGSIVARLPAALARAEELASDGEYELRLLRRPERHVVALWLHGDRDMFVSLTPFGFE
jgi:hypothetical protein